MIRKPLRRPLLARIREWWGRATQRGGDSPALERPVRLIPERIQVWEEYRYTFTTGPDPQYRATPDKVLGDIQIDLPFDTLSDFARADSAAVLGREAGAIVAQYGSLGFSALERTDIPTRFFSSESFTHYALPLHTPLVRENEGNIVERSERGDHERQHFLYTPADPVPFPFTLDVAISEEGATLTPDASPSMRSNQQRVMHVALEFKMMRPKGATEQNVRVSMDVFLLFWCAPVAAHQFGFDGPADATLNVDARFNQLSVGGVTIPFTSNGGGLLSGRIEFRILLKDPSAFQGIENVKGLFKMTGHGISMSAMRAEFFNAAGYVHPTAPDGNPIVQYRSELYGSFTLPLANVSHNAPVALSRHLTWFSPDSAPDAFPLIRDLFADEGFDQQGDLVHDAQSHRWTVTRQVDGKTLAIELHLRRRDSSQVMPQPEGDTAASAAHAAMRHMYYHDLTMAARYRGEWAKAQGMVLLLERRLRDKLHLRRKHDL